MPPRVQLSEPCTVRWWHRYAGTTYSPSLFGGSASQAFGFGSTAFYASSMGAYKDLASPGGGSVAHSTSTTILTAGGRHTPEMGRLLKRVEMVSRASFTRGLDC